MPLLVAPSTMSLVYLCRKCPLNSGSIQGSPLYTSSPQQRMATGMSRPALSLDPGSTLEEVPPKRRCLTGPYDLQVPVIHDMVPQKRQRETVSATPPTAGKGYSDEASPKRRCLDLLAALPTAQTMVIRDHALLKRRSVIHPPTLPTVPGKEYADEILDKQRRLTPLGYGITSAPGTKSRDQISLKRQCTAEMWVRTSFPKTDLPDEIPQRRGRAAPLSAAPADSTMEALPKQRRLAFLDTQIPEGEWASFQEPRDGCSQLERRFASNTSAQESAERNARYTARPSRYHTFTYHRYELVYEKIRGEVHLWIREEYVCVHSAMETCRHAARRFF